jgi:hypothetical protein
MTSAQSTIYSVLDEPYCLWEIDLTKRNLEFLSGIDAEYFWYLAKTHVDTLNDKETANRAAASLRLGFYNGAETLFSLLGALLQAPDCVYAWVAQCTTGQLRWLLRRIQSHDAQLPLKVKLEHLSWDTIAKAVLQPSNSDPAKAARNGELFSRLWARLASEYAKDVHVKEYNSLKHGFRVSHGGFRLAVGLEHEPGVAPPSEEMHSLGGSDFGSTFYALEQIGGESKANRSRRSRRVSVNWSAESMLLDLQLISMSIRNVVSALLLWNGKQPAEVHFVRPMEESDFDRPWRTVRGVLSANMDLVIPEDSVRATTKEELLDIWKKNSAR